MDFCKENFVKTRFLIDFLKKSCIVALSQLNANVKGAQMTQLKTYLEFKIDGKRLPREETRQPYYVLFEVVNFPVGLPIGSEVSLQIHEDADLQAWGPIYHYSTESGRYLVVRMDTNDMSPGQLHTLLNGTIEVSMRVNRGPSPQHCLYPHVVDFATGEMITVANWQ